ncbi:MAG TPA: IS200/IS605 family transposase [Pyrinomonadaceae bacterium]|nr:IS200/IS605 family transposase [Pyrinomonadaceae bacterium]
MPHTYTNLLYHIVFSTKERYPFIKAESKPRLYEYIGGTIRGLGGISLEIGGVDDHIHLLVKLKPTIAVAKFLQELKPGSTNWAKKHIHPKFEWQDGYAAFSVSESQVEAVRKYIQDQEIHHRKFDFDGEMKILLRKSGIDFDERYLWR